MKTITLTDDAYHRLLEWKSSSSESFSKVVIRVVPQRGTLGQMAQDVQSLPPLKGKQAKVMEETMAWGRDAGKAKDPWTS